MRFTIYCRFGESNIPMGSSDSLARIVEMIEQNFADEAVRVFDNKNNKWVDHNLMFCLRTNIVF